MNDTSNRKTRIHHLCNDKISCMDAKITITSNLCLTHWMLGRGKLSKLYRNGNAPNRKRCWKLGKLENWSFPLAVNECSIERSGMRAVRSEGVDDCNDGALYRICFNNFPLTGRNFLIINEFSETQFSMRRRWKSLMRIFTEIAFAIIMRGWKFALDYIFNCLNSLPVNFQLGKQLMLWDNPFLLSPVSSCKPRNNKH